MAIGSVAKEINQTLVLKPETLCLVFCKIIKFVAFGEKSMLESTSPKLLKGI